jgi:beta-barrel assembly-enhancing protease
MQRIVQSLGVVAGIQLIFGDVSGVAAVAVELLRDGAINKYSREHEHEADMDGVRTLINAGVDPQAMADFFDLLARREGNLPSVIGWLGTHPELGQRVTDVKAEAKRIGQHTTRPFTFNWAEVQRHAGAVADAPATRPSSVP